ncbi:permease-like cell division protein FtsX [Bacillus sp. FJAT-47783]|uniref:permease-like cell division protein FtsX n=1 Tax=Bacillus sp. FJAT-47783 TaxID=2922712 RepID=UPI001FADC208|nr:permease-like cell division protein FtsX [Bacillus sp. FJAT-47783]
MINTLGRHLRESLKSLARNAWMTIASVSAVTVTLLLVGTFLVIMLNLNNIATNIEEDVEIRVMVDVTANKEQQEQLKNNISSISKVESVEFSSKEEELNSLITSFGEEGEAFKLFKQENPLKDVFVVKAKNPADTSSVAKEIEKLDFVSEIHYAEETVKQLFKVVNTGRNIGLVLIIGLVFTAMFLISNTIKITIFARRKEIEIMKLVGATNSFIRWPFFLEGLFLGVLGSVLPIVFLLIAYNRFIDFIKPSIDGTFIKLLPMYPLTLQVSAIVLFVGACIGIWGSLMSVRKFLRV